MQNVEQDYDRWEMTRHLSKQLGLTIQTIALSLGVQRHSLERHVQDPKRFTIDQPLIQANNLLSNQERINEMKEMIKTIPEHEKIILTSMLIGLLKE